MHVRLVERRGLSHADTIRAVASRALTGKQFGSGALRQLLSFKRVALRLHFWRCLLDQSTHPSPRPSDNEQNQRTEH